MLPGRFPNLLVNGASRHRRGPGHQYPPHNLRRGHRRHRGAHGKPGHFPGRAHGAPARARTSPPGGVAAEHRGDPQRPTRQARGKLALRAQVHVEERPYRASKLHRHHGDALPGQQGRHAGEDPQALRGEEKALLSCIYDIRDESDRTGMRAVIELKKDADAEKVLAYLYKYSRFAGHLRGEHGGHCRGQARAHGAQGHAGALHRPPERTWSPGARSYDLDAGPGRARTFCEGLIDRRGQPGRGHRA